jgi:small subunit ribosomal protein S10|uniref:ribosomal protein S10 n=1 Tax=Stephanopyxis turris TaxID=515487 RepID=UPI0022F2D727|nr:ribosomal protein S10 [Stephanopyxis turris]WAJ57675.1 ribosomal protein S10 [Stephanopyxis turris]
MSTKTDNRIRVRLESFNHELLNSSCQKIISLAQSIDLNTVGTVTLPTDKRIYCVLRSPHVDKDSREHFELRIHKRILDIYYDTNVNIFDLLSESDLPSGVLYRICLS